MPRFRCLLTIIAGAALLLPCPAGAGPLRTEQVCAKAKWLVHADVKAFLASKTGAVVLEELKKKGLQDVLNNIQEAFAFDPTKDLKSITVYGPRFGQQPTVILIHATLDRDRITEMLKGNETYRELKYGGHTVHQWTDNPQADKPGPTKFGVFHGNDLAVMTEDLRLMQQAVDVLDKKAESLVARGASRPLPSAARGPFLTARLMELPPLGKGNPAAAILGKIASAALDAGESKGRVRAHVELTARTAKTATNLRKIAEGLLALVELATPEQAGKTSARPPDPVLFTGQAIPAELTAVLQDVKVTARNRVIQIDADVPVAKAIALLRRLLRQKEATAAKAETAEKP